MKNLNNYVQDKLVNTNINERLVINSKTKLHHYTCQPKDKQELRNILEKRLIRYNDRNGDLNDIDVSLIDNMHDLFWGLQPENIQIDEWNVSNVKNMNGMFFQCNNFNCDLSDWDVSNVEDMESMFSGCSNFNSDLSQWDVSKVKNMKYMFFGCYLLKNKPSWYKNN